MTNTKISASLIKCAFENEHYPALFSGKNTHGPALEFTKQIVAYTKDDSLITEMIRSGLPNNYDSDTINEIRGMIQWSLKHGFDEKSEEDGDKTQAQLLIELVEEKGCELFHDVVQRPFLIYKELGRKKVYPLGSTAAKRLLQRLFYKEYGRGLSQQPFKQACELLEAKALFDCPEFKVYLRVAPYNGDVVINLANAAGEVTVVNKIGYSMTAESPVMFVNSPAMSELPTPVAGRDDALDEFQNLFGLDDTVFARVMAFLINCLKPEGPYLCLLIEGEQGSGKSFLTESIKTLIDPSQAPKIRLPNNERDLMIQAKDNAVILFDNVSGMKADISDALCSMSTGGGFTTRKLYTDDELMIFTETRPFILNGISAYATRPDLLERSVSIHLQPMQEGLRKSESDMRKAFNDLRPALLDKLCKIVSCGLRNYNDVKTPTSVRMADAARWLIAGEPETGLKVGALLDALLQSQQEIIVESLSRNSLAVALIQLAESGRFAGTMGELLYRLGEGRTAKADRYFPQTAAHLSRALDRLRPALVKADLVIKFGPKTRTGKFIEVYLADEEGQAMAAQVKRRGTPTPEGGIDV